MESGIKRRDLIWGYFAHFFSISSGIITLPIILKLLSPAEIGLNYLILTIGSFVTFFDFGFAPQFSRNLTFIFNGAQELKKEGISTCDNNRNINYHLLTVMLSTARFLYQRLSLILVMIMITFGTYYTYEITNGFTSVKNSFLVWLIFCISIYFDMYYAYYGALLNGKGLITEWRKALVYSKLVYTILAVGMLFLNFGLISIVIANLISPFVMRYFCYKYFFTVDIKTGITKQKPERKEVLELLSTTWFNAKKLGLVYLGGFAISRIGIFTAGLYLTLEEVASYGLMTQLVGMIAVLSTTVGNLYSFRFTSLRMKQDYKLLILEFSYTVAVFLILYLTGVTIFILFGNSILTLLGSSTELPSYIVLFIYCIVILLETNHSIFSSFILTTNKIPFVKPTLIAGLLIAVFSFLVLRFTNLRVLGIVLVPGVIQILYNNWKWPYLVCRDFKTTYFRLLTAGFSEILNRIRMSLRSTNLIKSSS